MSETTASAKMAAQRQLRWSNILAWPAVVVLLLGVPQVSDAAGRTVAILVAMASIAMIIVGTVLGQRAKNRLKRIALAGTDHASRLP